MLRRTLNRWIPDYAILPLVTTGIVNFIVYTGSKLIQALAKSEATDMTLPIDSFFPFAPIWVLAYIGTFAFWTYQYINIAREGPMQACRLVTADFIAKLICMLFFNFLPTTNVRPEVVGSGVSAYLMRFIFWIDSPTNLFPSIHCFIAWLGTRQLFETKRYKHKVILCIACTLGSVLVFLSTLFTKQHVFVDVVAGILVAEVGFVLAKYTPVTKLFIRLNEKFLNSKFCAYYKARILHYDDK